MQTLKHWVIGRRPKRTLIRATLLGVCCFLLFRFVLRPIWTDGSSMEPTVPNRSLHWASEAAYWLSPPRRGDIVMISRHRHEIFLKRILGLPGERVAFIDGQLYINGDPVEEPYVMHRADWNMPEKVLADGQYFVVGDNRGMPMATHKMGVVPRSYIRARFVK